ncbi:MAG TPA: histidinol-phosphate transaminase, partial [Desulfurivibrionaceae bacterium]|nr:histidinol-phosphate transaminase [Desulfurivibrionaceae bacterium]
WGPSPKAVAAIAANLEKLHRYPDGSCYYLAQALAQKLGVDPAELVFGNGSNEIIGLLIAAFLAPGQEVVTSHPTFLVYQKMVQAQGGVNRVVPLREMRHDLGAILAAITAKTRLIFLDNPNNPTGTVFTAAEFEAFLDRVPEGVIVALDEAYVDFVEPALQLDARKYLAHKTPVVALRTFSKAYGLAGLRVGYGIMHREIADYLHRVRQPFNVNQLAQVAALAALDDDDHYEKTLRLTREGMAWTACEVEKFGCKAFPSQTNFFLIDVKGDGKQLYERMLTKGVIVRPMQAYGYPTYIRITVGLPEENIRFVKSLEETLQELGYGR